MKKERNYTMGYGRLKRAYAHGFSLTKEGILSLEKGDSHFLVLGVFNSYRKGYEWGRLHFIPELPKDCILIVRAFAWEGEEKDILEFNDALLDAACPYTEKKQCFIRAGGVESVNHPDTLFYELTGQYLFISIEVVGEGQGSIRDMVLYNPGDNFMQTFPEIYQKKGEFFHRYMSVFSTLYFEAGQQIQGLQNYLDISRAPDFMLWELASWLGLQIPQGLLEEKMYRRFLREAYDLNKRKGTKGGMSRIVELMLGVKPVIVEGNRCGGAKSFKNHRGVFGESMWDITILIFYPYNERVREQLLYLLLQFKPARSRLKLIFCEECSVLDSRGFLDKNGKLARRRFPILDKGEKMDGSVVLEK